jgi:hypothetical protein
VRSAEALECAIGKQSPGAPAMSGGLISGTAETITTHLPRPSVGTPSGSDRLATTTPDGRDVTIAEFCARVNDFGKV